MWFITYTSAHALMLRFAETPRANALAAVPRGTALSRIFPVGRGATALRALQRFLNRAPAKYGAVAGWAMRIAASGLACTPLFVALMGIFQLLSHDTLGAPGQRTYRVTLAVYAIVAARGVAVAHRSGALALPQAHRGVVAANKVLFGTAGAFLSVFMWIGLTADSTRHVSTGCHQTFGPSRVVKDVMGFDREDHLGSEGPVRFSKHDYRLAVPSDGPVDASGSAIVLPEPSGVASQWYSIVGIARNDRAGELRRQLVMTALAVAGYGVALLNVLSSGPPYLP